MGAFYAVVCERMVKPRPPSMPKNLRNYAHFKKLGIPGRTLANASRARVPIFEALADAPTDELPNLILH
jgi:hypothetical protein